MVKEQEDEKYTTQEFMLKAKMEKQKKEEEENDRKKNLQNQVWIFYFKNMANVEFY